jgi:hypothetical protein
LAALWLATAVPAIAQAQAYHSDQADPAARKHHSAVTQSVRNPASFAANEAQFKEYFNKYYFPNMTGSGPDQLATLGRARYSLFRDYLWNTDSSDQVLQTLNELAYKAMGNIVVANPPYHPAVRYNAILILGMLDEQYAREGATPRPPKPHSRANAALCRIVDLAATGNDNFPPAVVLGAVIGLDRHAKLHDSLPAANIQAMSDALLKLAGHNQPILDMDRDDYNWLRLRAAEALATLGSPGPNNAVHDALVKLTGELKNMDDRCAAAALLAKIKYDGATVDGAATADALFALARDMAADESKRAKDFNEKQIAGGGYVPGYSDGAYLPDGIEQPEKFPRRRVLARLTDLRTGLVAAKPLVPADAQPKVDALVAAIEPVRQAAIDKEVELKLTQAILQMAANINLAVPSAQPEAATADTPEFE